MSKEYIFRLVSSNPERLFIEERLLEFGCHNNDSLIASLEALVALLKLHRSPEQVAKSMVMYKVKDSLMIR